MPAARWAEGGICVPWGSWLLLSRVCVGGGGGVDDCSCTNVGASRSGHQRSMCCRPVPADLPLVRLLARRESECERETLSTQFGAQPRQCYVAGGVIGLHVASGSASLGMC